MVVRDGVDGRVPVTTLEAAAGLVGLELVPDPGVGADLPAFDPVAPLPIDDAAAAVIGAWYALGDEVLAQVGRRCSRLAVGADAVARALRPGRRPPRR